MRQFFALMVVLLFMSCTKEKTIEKIEPDVDRFFSVYQTFLFTCQADSFGIDERQALFDSALAKHNMSGQQFDATLEYLENNPDKFIEAFEIFDAQFRAELDRRMYE